MGSYEEDQSAYADPEDTREIEAMRKMFVGGLNRDTTQEIFYDYFSQYGTIVDKVIITDPNTKVSRGFGFVTYEVSDSVEKVFKSRPHKIDEKEVEVKRAMPREFNTAGAHAKTTKLFVGGFKGLDIEPSDLQTYIESRHENYGHIVKIDLVKDRETQANRGFGFIECSDNDFADRLAISEATFQLKGRNMSIKKAEQNQSGGGNNSGGGPMRGMGYSGRGGGGNRGGRGGNNRGRGGYNSGYDQGNNYSTSYPANQGGYSQGYGAQSSYGQQQQAYSGYDQQGYNQQGGYQALSGGNYQQNRNQRYNPY